MPRFLAVSTLAVLIAGASLAVVACGSSVAGTYTVDGDNITLKAKGVDEVEKGTIEDGRLVFKTVTWVKE